MKRNKESKIADLLKTIDKSKYNLPIIFGYDQEENLVVKDFSEVKNILMTGCTASGKSMFGYTLLYTLMNLYDPGYVSFYIVDMKRIEFSQYEDSPYLNASPLMGGSDEFDSVLSTLEGYALSETDSKYTVVLIDTFIDLVGYDKERFESIIKNISEKENYYIVMWDSRPSPKLFTNNIMECFDTKIMFRVVSTSDSKFFCDLDIGTELLGKGDAVVTSNLFDTPIRVQCPYVSYGEIEISIRG